MKCYCLPGLVDIRDVPRMFQEVFPGDGLYSGEPKAQLLEALSRSCCSSVQVCNRVLYIGMVPSCILWYETYKKRTTLFHASGLAEIYAFNEVQNHSFGLKIFQQCSLVCRHVQFVVVSDREWVLLHRIRWLFFSRQLPLQLRCLHRFKFSFKFPTTQCHSSSFQFKAIRVWNKLLSHAVDEGNQGDSLIGLETFHSHLTDNFIQYFQSEDIPMPSKKLFFIGVFATCWCVNEVFKLLQPPTIHCSSFMQIKVP